MKNRFVKWISALLAMLLCLSAVCPALAVNDDYTMAEKLVRQLWAGSGFSGTLEVELTAKPGSDALQTLKPFLVDWDYIYVRPTTETSGQHRVDMGIMDGETAVSEAHFQLKDGVLAASSPLLGDGWVKVVLEDLIQPLQDGAEDTLAAQVLPAVSSSLARTGMPSLVQFVLPQLLQFRDSRSDLESVVEYMTLRTDLWIEGHRQNAELGKLDDGSPVIEVNYRISPASIKSQLKQMVLDVLGNESMLGALKDHLDEEAAQLLLNPAYQPYYFAAIDQLPLEGDLTLNRTVDMQGETLALHLSLPFYDATGGNMTLHYAREKGEGDLPDNNTVTLENARRSTILTYLTYRSMTDVTVYQGTLTVKDAENFQVEAEELKPLPAMAFTLRHSATKSREDGDLNVYQSNWQLRLEPDPNGGEADAFLPLDIVLDSRFSSKTPQTSATKAVIDLTVSGEERDQTIALRFNGETRRQWTVEEIPAEMTDLLSISGDALEDLLATLLAEGTQMVGFFMNSVEEAPAAEEAAAEPAGQAQTDGE